MDARCYDTPFILVQNYSFHPTIMWSDGLVQLHLTHCSRGCALVDDAPHTGLANVH